MNRLWTLQALRGLAATLVVIAHGIDSTQAIHSSRPWLAYGHLENLGAIGVDIFFVISGFIITATVARNPTLPARTFLLQRLIRVLPPYYLLSLPWLIYGLLTQGIYLSKLLTSVSLWPVMPGSMQEPYLGIGWTLCFEMLFYGAVFLTRLLQRPAALVLLLFAPLITAQLLLDLPLLRFIGNPIIIEFLFGVVLALGHERLRHCPRLIGGLGAGAVVWLALLISFGFGGVSEAQFTLDASLSLRRALLFGVPALMITAFFVSAQLAVGGRAAQWLSFFGDASYSIYLVHLTLIVSLEYLLSRSSVRVDGNLWLLIIVVGSLSAGALTHLLIERPLTRALRRRFSV